MGDQKWKDGLKEIQFTRYAEMRMRIRNITEAEVREALQQSRENHFFNTRHERWNVRHTFPNLGIALLVSYEETSDVIVVVTVYDANEG